MTEDQLREYNALRKARQKEQIPISAKRYYERDRAQT
jgi:hypothetical protein